MDLSHIRQDHSREGLEIEDLHPDPYVEFESWFDNAAEANLPEPHSMSLATVDNENKPSLRTVHLKLFDRNGFVFFTNYASRKAQQIAGNPSVSLLFTWISLGRQITINGTASKISTADSLKYFVTRPRGSQIGAWVSHQSQVISSRTMLEMKYQEMKQKFVDGEVPLPSFWGGYRVMPKTIEFWQSRPNRLHDRFLYSATGKDWKIERLSP